MKTLTAPVFLREIGEPPNVAETDCVADGGEQKCQLAVPIFTLVLAGLRSEYTLTLVASELATPAATPADWLVLRNILPDAEGRS